MTLILRTSFASSFSSSLASISSSTFMTMTLPIPSFNPQKTLFLALISSSFLVFTPTIP